MINFKQIVESTLKKLFENDIFRSADYARKGASPKTFAEVVAKHGYTHYKSEMGYDNYVHKDGNHEIEVHNGNNHWNHVKRIWDDGMDGSLAHSDTSGPKGLDDHLKSYKHDPDDIFDKIKKVSNDPNIKHYMEHLDTNPDNPYDKNWKPKMRMTSIHTDPNTGVRHVDQYNEIESNDYLKKRHPHNPLR